MVRYKGVYHTFNQQIGITRLVGFLSDGEVVDQIEWIALQRTFNLERGYVFSFLESAASDLDKLSKTLFVCTSP